MLSASIGEDIKAGILNENKPSILDATTST
jgi:hypothetical protein